MNTYHNELKNKLTALADHPCESRVSLVEISKFFLIHLKPRDGFLHPHPASKLRLVFLPLTHKIFLYKQPVHPKSFPDKHVFPAEN